MKFKVFLTKLKFFYLKLFGKIKKMNTSVEIKQNKNSNIKNVLLIFPLKEEAFRVALYSFRNLLTQYIKTIFTYQDIYMIFIITKIRIRLM